MIWRKQIAKGHSRFDEKDKFSFADEVTQGVEELVCVCCASWGDVLEMQESDYSGFCPIQENVESGQVLWRIRNIGVISRSVQEVSHQTLSGNG